MSEMCMGAEEAMGKLSAGSGAVPHFTKNVRPVWSGAPLVEYRWCVLKHSMPRNVLYKF